MRDAGFKGSPLAGHINGVREGEIKSLIRHIKIAIAKWEGINSTHELFFREALEACEKKLKRTNL